ncbi:hypothetical protein CDIMF43_80071 [Carnobacterium divergens]|nr:hypothetical protein CDIMF43_80071 [Carnobacterium divergens]
MLMNQNQAYKTISDLDRKVEGNESSHQKKFVGNSSNIRFEHVSASCVSR